METSSLFSCLERMGAVLTGRHFVYTSGHHGTAYINMRVIGHDARELLALGSMLGTRLGSKFGTEVRGFIGPETLGRQLAMGAATTIDTGTAIWCAMPKRTTGGEMAALPPNMNFEELIQQIQLWAIVDDLLTTGSSIRDTAALVTKHGGTVVAAGVVVRRTPHISAEVCTVPKLEVLVDVEGFETFSPAECRQRGPCSRLEPMVMRPGHGHEWIKLHRDYPVA